MLDMMNKMAELKFEAPLAQFEETDEWTKIVDDEPQSKIHQVAPVQQLDNALSNKVQESSGGSKTGCNQCGANNNTISVMEVADGDNFGETFSGSLEDLVHTFDDKITRCFCDYEESVEKLAPVQIRTQEEIMNECQMWWTITGNFGNILPIDWSKSYARKVQLPTLNLNNNPQDDSSDDLSSEDEAVANDLDMHTLILSGPSGDSEPPTADEVIREIDDIMEEGTSDDCTPDSEHPKEPHSPLIEEKLKTLDVSQLNEVYMELEMLIRDYSETLIAELALRDELEFEKELKNSFISLLLAVQNRRRQYHVEKKRNSKIGSTNKNSINEPKYLTTVIPYHLDNGPLNNQALQVLIKKIRVML
ncbi:fasciculation and elongation protein zeta-2 isoform X2 [Daktulosphaira vitifoliae]|uniref:fasciculation and elongation protein zeta-2 isoform X2 n=1 Tax=Daktulosphaira vitifoliae TaxID=58002 RepID=UPI0021A9D3A3|nr:fasciculation and elongation protein zeta-2 isoform X2 [Daktulosphaira vitifoliae]